MFSRLMGNGEYGNSDNGGEGTEVLEQVSQGEASLLEQIRQINGEWEDM